MPSARAAIRAGNRFLVSDDTGGVAPPLRTLGILGAVLVAVGVSIIGAGFLNEAIATSSETSCEYSPPRSGCTSVDDNALNSTAYTVYFLGVGAICTGVGLGLVLVAALGFMSRWPPALPPGLSPPPVPPPSTPPGAP